MGRPLPILFSTRFAQVVWVVFRSDDELHLGPIGTPGNVEREWGIASLVCPKTAAIDPDGRLVVDPPKCSRILHPSSRVGSASGVRYKQARINEGSLIPLAAVSGEKGT